jgi:flagellar capping protein FliD
MSTPITLSGFNNIDFASIVTAIIAQERRPQNVLKQRQQQLSTQSEHLSTFSTKLAALDAAATALTNPTSLSGRSSANTDTTAVTFAPGIDTPVGTYDVVVTELARAQVTASTSTSPDRDTTVVATGGSLTIGGVAVTLTESTTLRTSPTPSTRPMTSASRPPSFRAERPRIRSCSPARRPARRTPSRSRTA